VPFTKTKFQEIWSNECNLVWRFGQKKVIKLLFFQIASRSTMIHSVVVGVLALLCLSHVIYCQFTPSPPTGNSYCNSGPCSSDYDCDLGYCCGGICVEFPPNKIPSGGACNNVCTTYPNFFTLDFNHILFVFSKSFHNELSAFYLQTIVLIFFVVGLLFEEIFDSNFRTPELYWHNSFLDGLL
jgi:hypothetical protein